MFVCVERVVKNPCAVAGTGILHYSGECSVGNPFASSSLSTVSMLMPC